MFFVHRRSYLVLLLLLLVGQRALSARHDIGIVGQISYTISGINWRAPSPISERWVERSLTRHDIGKVDQRVLTARCDIGIMGRTNYTISDIGCRAPCFERSRDMNSLAS